MLQFNQPMQFFLCDEYYVAANLYSFFFNRGPAVEWYDALSAHFRPSRSIRHWFVQNILFAQPSRISEYLLESPSNEVSIIWIQAQ